MSTMAKKCRFHVRWMIRRDLGEVMQIEGECFPEYPWDEERLVNCLRQRNCIGMVAEHDEHIVGFMIYELHKTRLHVLNFAVARDFQRHGVGRAMAETLIGKLSVHRRSHILLEIRDSNFPAQMFFRACGFRAVSVLRDFYDDCGDDAYVFRYLLGKGA